jgi:prevent-host-death family protein
MDHMSIRIGVCELRQHANKYVALVKGGARVEITERGRLVAVLAPPDRTRRSAKS